MNSGTTSHAERKDNSMAAEQNTTTNDSSKHDNGVIGTIIELGAATTKMTIDQMQNAFTALTNPGAAIDHVKDTLHALSEAMNNSSGGSNRSSSDQMENDLRGAPTGREHVGTASDLDSSAYSSSSSSPYSQGSSSSSQRSSWGFSGRSMPRTINRRKS